MVLILCAGIFCAFGGTAACIGPHIPSFLPLCFLCIANFPHGHLYTLKPIWLFRLSFLKCPQLVDDKIQRNRNQQIYNRRNRFAYAEERNLYPKQNIRKDRRAAVADICFSKAFQFTAPIVCIPGKTQTYRSKKRHWQCSELFPERCLPYTGLG